jgi:hypothetical protein
VPVLAELRITTTTGPNLGDVEAPDRDRYRAAVAALHRDGAHVGYLATKGRIDAFGFLLRGSCPGLHLLTSPYTRPPRMKLRTRLLSAARA